jgi:hypothetical protein
MTTFFGIEPFYSIRPKAMDWVEVAPEVEEWLQTEVSNPEAVAMYEFLENTLMELIKLGSCVGKTGYERITRKSIREFGGEETDYFFDVKNGASLLYVPLPNFLIRMAEYTLEGAPWIGEEHIWTWSQMKQMAGSGRLDSKAVEEIKHQWVDRQREQGSAKEYQDDVDQLIRAEPEWHSEYRIQEIWARFDVDGDGYDEEIVFDFHHESSTIMSIRYNWYEDLRRPYRFCNYIPIEGRIWGVGVGKQNEQFQEEATTIHRQRLDNATLANMSMLALKKNSGYGPKEPIFPGKMWFLDDVQDISPVKLSEVYPSSYSNEQIVVTYSEKRTGVNEVILGQPQEGTPGTATGDLARLREGNKRFDLTMRNIRRWLSRIGADLLSCYQQFGDQGRHWITEGEDGQFVDKFLNMPPTMVREGAVVEVSASDSITNKDVYQRQWLGLSQVLQSYYQGQMQIAAMVDPELAAQIAMMALQATTEATRQLLETFDVLDAEKLLLTPFPPLTGGGNGQSAGALPPAGGVGQAGGVSPAIGQPGLVGIPALGAPASGAEGQ